MTKTENAWCVSDQCPDDSELRVFSCKLLQRFDDISFKQWQTTNSCTLMTHSAPVEEYIDMLVCAVENYVQNHFCPKVKVTFFTWLCRKL